MSHAAPLVPAPPASALPREWVPLATLAAGDEAIVRRLNANSAILQRLIDMGVLPGTRVRLLRAAPFGGPMMLWVKGFRLSLRRDEACTIFVEKVPATGALA